VALDVDTAECEMGNFPSVLVQGDGVHSMLDFKMEVIRVVGWQQAHKWASGRASGRLGLGGMDTHVKPTAGVRCGQQRHDAAWQWSE
jgi:hypothetical protein